MRPISRDKKTSLQYLAVLFSGSVFQRLWDTNDLIRTFDLALPCLVVWWIITIISWITENFQVTRRLHNDQ